MTSENAKERVARGAALLDAHAPNWRAQIDTTSLDLSKYSLCILGQVFGGYDTGLCTLGMSDREESAEAALSGFLATNPEDYIVLKAAWVAILTEG